MTAPGKRSDHGRIVVGLAQLTCRLGDKEANLERAEQLLAQLAGRATIACLPEMFDVGYELEHLGARLFDLAEPVPGPTTERLASLARKLGLAIVAGVLERDQYLADLLYDTAIVIDRQGELVGQYRKSHLYPSEHRFFRAGSELAVLELEGLRIGVAICFEHAFPPIFATLARRGAQIVFNPSAVPVGFGYLQDLRTRARAQDNQIFVAAVNHVGKEGEVTYCGRSQVADPRGEVIAMAPDDREAAIIADLSLDLIREQRRQEPIFRSLKPELYEA
jgi:predicted amidohydrolase